MRPAALVGRGIDTVTTRHFEAPRLLTVRDCAPAWQFCHVEDLASALVTVVDQGIGPVVTVAAEGTLTQERVEQVSGMRHVQLSESLALGTAERLHRVGVLPAPATDLAYALHPWAVSSQPLREAGWSPAYDNETALGRPAGRHPRAPRRGRPAGRPQGRRAGCGQCGCRARRNGCHHAATAAQRRRSMNQQTRDGSDGGAQVVLAEVREDDLSLDEVVAAVRHPRAGGIATFVGVVREHDQGAAVDALDYSAHPTAPDVLRAGGRGGRRPAPPSSPWPRCTASGTWRSATSRSSWRSAPPHRGAALEACRELIDTLKARVPIWKHQLFSDGSDEWVGLP